MLARRGQRVRLIERRADPRSAPPERGRSINLALAARGMAALEHAGLSDRIAPQMIAMPGRMLHDEHAALQFLPYGQNDHEVIHAMSRDRLNRILIEAAAERPVPQGVLSGFVSGVESSSVPNRRDDERGDVRCRP